LKARGIPYYCFEKGSFIGGNWRYENDNGMSSAYRSLNIKTSRRVMAFKTLPMPHHFPDYPDHFQMAECFDEYANHFGLWETIRFTPRSSRSSRWTGVGGDRRGRRRARDQPRPRGAGRQRHHWDSGALESEAESPNPFASRRFHP
jgi:dimethylaniline monooxygenase (N-oxide forming)